MITNVMKDGIILMIINVTIVVTAIVHLDGIMNLLQIVVLLIIKLLVVIVINNIISVEELRKLVYIY